LNIAQLSEGVSFCAFVENVEVLAKRVVWRYGQPESKSSFLSGAATGQW
jgi:hypothetical protein